MIVYHEIYENLSFFIALVSWYVFAIGMQSSRQKLTIFTSVNRAYTENVTTARATTEVLLDGWIVGFKTSIVDVIEFDTDILYGVGLEIGDKSQNRFSSTGDITNVYGLGVGTARGVMGNAKFHSYFRKGLTSDNAERYTKLWHRVKRGDTVSILDFHQDLGSATQGSIDIFVEIELLIGALGRSSKFDSPPPAYGTMTMFASGSNTDLCMMALPASGRIFNIRLNVFPYSGTAASSGYVYFGNYMNFGQGFVNAPGDVINISEDNGMFIEIGRITNDVQSWQWLTEYKSLLFVEKDKPLLLKYSVDDAHQSIIEVSFDYAPSHDTVIEFTYKTTHTDFDVSDDIVNALALPFSVFVTEVQLTAHGIIADATEIGAYMSLMMFKDPALMTDLSLMLALTTASGDFMVTEDSDQNVAMLGATLAIVPLEIDIDASGAGSNSYSGQRTVKVNDLYPAGSVVAIDVTQAGGSDPSTSRYFVSLKGRTRGKIDAYFGDKLFSAYLKESLK